MACNWSIGQHFANFLTIPLRLVWDGRLLQLLYSTYIHGPWYKIIHPSPSFAFDIVSCLESRNLQAQSSSMRWFFVFSLSVWPIPVVPYHVSGDFRRMHANQPARKLRRDPGRHVCSALRGVRYLFPIDQSPPVVRTGFRAMLPLTHSD